MKQYVNTFAILFGGVCAGLAVLSAYNSQPVYPQALAIGGIGTALAACLSFKRLA